MIRYKTPENNSGVFVQTKLAEVVDIIGDLILTGAAIVASSASFANSMYEFDDAIEAATPFDEQY